VDNWGEIKKITPSDGADYDYFGISVSISGDTAIVGAHYDDDNGFWSGSAYVLESVGTGWYFGPSLNYARYGLDTVAHNGKIYAIGGWNGDDKLEVLDTGTGSWVELQSLPTGQAGVAAALVGNKIYTMGDYGGYNTCQIYDIDTDTWQSGPDIPIGLYWATAEAVGEKIYLIGGYPVGPALDTLYILDTVSNTWSQGSNMLSGIQRPASAVYDNQIYVFASGVYYKYTIATDTWTSFPAPPSGHGNASEAVTVGDKIYLIGGNLGYIYEAYTTVEIYDPVSQTWEVGPELNVGRYQFGGSHVNGRIYAIGGRDENAQALSSVEILEIQIQVEPSPDIKANGSDGPVDLSYGETLSVTIELDPGDYTDYQADWWCVAEVPFPPWWYYYDAITEDWLSGFKVSYQGPLFELTPPSEVLNTSDLPIGSYTFYFGVDTNRNGNLDEPLYYDSVEVDITPP